MPSTTRANPPDQAEALETVLDHESSGRVSRREVPRTLLVPATTTQLMRMAFEEWCMIVALCILAIVAPAWVYPVVLIPLAGRYHALGVILHDVAHMSVRSSRLGRRLLELFCGLPIASTVSAMRYHHLRHHRDSGMSTDPYFKRGRQTPLWWTLYTLRGALLFPFWTVRGVVGVAASLFPSLRTTYGRVFLQDRSGEDLQHSRELVDCARDEWLQLAFQIALLPAFILWPRAMALFYVAPVIVAHMVSIRRLLVEHQYEHVEDRRAETIIATTRDSHIGWLGAVLLAPRNIGFHIVHHLHPQVSLTALPELRSWYRDRHPELFP